MPAQALRLIEPQENIEQLKAQLKAELDECTNADSTGRNHLIEFMAAEGIWHISELDYPTRERFERVMRERYQWDTARGYISAYDRVKQHSVRTNVTLLVNGKAARPAYENKILYLPYHPNQEIAMRYLNATNKKDYVWDFQRKAPEKLKRQVYDILHYLLELEEDAESQRIKMLGLRELYDFCAEKNIADIEEMELDEVEQFLNQENSRLKRKYKAQACNFCRKALFMQNDEINWNAHVWYMERLRIQPERMDASAPVTYLSFLEVRHKRNRDLLKKYLRYGIGITNLSISVLRSELIMVRKFLEETKQAEDEDICMVTPEQMDTYFRKEAEKSVQAETFNKKVMCLRQFFEFLRIRKYIEKVPFDENYYLKKTFARHNDRSVAEEAWNEIFENLHKFPEETRLMFLHLWGIGLRISEVCTLKGNAYYIQGRDAWIQVYQTKMKNYKRIPIPEALYKLMKVYIRKYGIKADEYVFKNTKGGAYCKSTFKYKMLKGCKENNIQNGEYIFKSHDYRHTIATHFYDTGVSLQSIRDYLGHDYEEMTQQYVDYMPKKIDKANEEYFSQNSSLASRLRKGVKKDGQ